MSVVGVEHNPKKLITLSSLGNMYLNDVIFQLQSLFPSFFKIEEEIFFLLGGIGFSYRCRRSKRKGTRLYLSMQALDIRHLFSLLHHSTTEDIQIGEFSYVPKSILDFRNVICEGMSKKQDIIFMAYQIPLGVHIDENEQESSKEIVAKEIVAKEIVTKEIVTKEIVAKEIDPFDMISVQEQILLDISNEIIKISQCKYDYPKDNKFEQENFLNHHIHQDYGQIRLFRLVDYDCTIVRVWDAISETVVTYSFREFWNMFEKLEVYEVPLSICRRKLYELNSAHICSSYTKEKGILENFIEWQNALRRKSIRNSWWSLFCEHIQIKDDTHTSNRIYHVVSQLFVQLVLSSSGGYRTEMGRICQLIADHSLFLNNPDPKSKKHSIQDNQQETQKIHQLFYDISELYLRSSKKIRFLGEILLSLDIPHIQSIRQAIAIYRSKNDLNSLFYESMSDVRIPPKNDKKTIYQISQHMQSIDWESYFDVMDEAISSILEIESRITRKFSEIHSLLSNHISKNS